MSVYYNEFDPKAASWLRELIKNGHIADGVVDERSILDVEPSDLKGFSQCHFFAGIGGWSYALRLAGIPDDFEVWTGSPPCQPFSVAGKQKGKDDERHLAPHFAKLVSEGRPKFVFGEQVASSDVFGKVAKSAGRKAEGESQWAWLDDLFSEMEAAHYACGATDLPASGVGAPHLRQRTFFGAVRMEDTLGLGRRGRGDGYHEGEERGASTQDQIEGRCSSRKLGDTHASGFQARNTDSKRFGSPKRHVDALVPGLCNSNSDTHDGGWTNPDWIGCRDGKWRPVEPGTFPLVNGLPHRVGLLRGYGNAIVPQAAAIFVKSFLEANEGLC